MEECKFFSSSFCRKDAVKVSFLFFLVSFSLHLARRFSSLGFRLLISSVPSAALYLGC
jgi:hypothetical protein